MSNPEQDGARHPRLGYLIVGVAVLAFFGLFAFSLQAFQSSGERKAEPFVLGQPDLTDGIEIRATVLGVDPIKGEMTTRLNFAPKGSINKSGTLARDVTLIVSAGSGNVERPFKKGLVMPPTDVVLELFGGQVSNYPFDHYQAQLIAEIVETRPAPTPGVAPAADEGDKIVPISMQVFEALHGFGLGVGSDAEPRHEGTVDGLITVDRAASTVGFASFVMILMWLLSLGAFLLAMSVALRGRKVELAMFGFLGSLLFAFPAMRNAVPGAPPIGAFIDYLSFFWVEALVAVSLVTILSVWIFRPSRP